MKNWKKFDTATVKKVHGDYLLYRDLYLGHHVKLFKRAQDLVEKGEVTDRLLYGEQTAKDIQTPYQMANISKAIVEIPATFVGRSIGKITTSLNEETQAEAGDLNEETEGNIQGPADEAGQSDFNTKVLNKQQEIIEELVLNSRLNSKHYSNILQHQIDGGLVGLPRYDDDGPRIEFKARDVYFPHEDGRGLDLVFDVEIEEANYLHVYRERREDGGLKVTDILYSIDDATRETTPIPQEEAARLLKRKPEDMVKFYEDRKRTFVEYFGNDVTFMNPLGVSALYKQDGKQDEINWSLTRNALTFERNGRPHVSVTSEIMESLKADAEEKYGDEKLIDHRNLSLTEMDASGNSIKIHQIDITKIGDFEWIKDLMKIMLMETQTSERAIDFYMEGGNASQTGIAKYYDLLTSLIKAERIQLEYIFFLKNLVKNALWLMNRQDSSVQIEEPEIQLNSMLPSYRKELLDENNSAYEAGTQSLETTIQRNNPTAASDWVRDEKERIELEKTDSMTVGAGAANAADYLNRRRLNNPINVPPAEGANTDDDE